MANDYADQGLYRVLVKSNTIGTVRAWAPDEISVQVESAWDSPFATVGSSVDTLSRFFGASTQSEFQHTQIWQGTSPITLTIPLRFFALSSASAEEDVTNPIRNLMKLALPDRNGNFLKPPGPLPTATKENILSTGANPDKVGEIITVSIGRFLYFSPVIVTSVNSNIPLKFTEDSVPLTASVDLTFNTFRIATKSDLDNMFPTGTSRSGGFDNG